MEMIVRALCCAVWRTLQAFSAIMNGHNEHSLLVTKRRAEKAESYLTLPPAYLPTSKILHLLHGRSSSHPIIYLIRSSIHRTTASVSPFPTTSIYKSPLCDVVVVVVALLDMFAHESVVLPSRKRRRPALSCIECRRRKIKVRPLPLGFLFPHVRLLLASMSISEKVLGTPKSLC
jgi:hypothetical protein